MESAPLLVTGSIIVKAKHTQIISSKVRESQYFSSIVKWIVCSSLKNIVFCENTNSPFNAKALEEIAKHFNKRFEYITFTGNDDNIAMLGKGYGEGEIVEYAINNSKILRQSKSFIKITGRLFVVNADDIITSLDGDRNYFIQNRRPLRKSIGLVDTRFYHVSKSFYNNTLMHLYKRVDDDNGVFLEHVFFDRLRLRRNEVSAFPVYPDFEGFSGSQGHSYHLGKVRYAVRNFLNNIGFYRV